MTTLLDTLAILPSGRLARPHNIDTLGVYLRKHYYTIAEQDREKRHRLRDELYHDGGIGEMHRLIDSVYQDPEVRERRKLWARWARFNNLTKRVVNELSSVYQQPARRTVSNQASNATYQLAQGAVNIHTVSKRWNRMLNLHRAILVGPRVDITPGDPDSRRPSIQIVTPANARLITHPNNPHQIVAVAHRLRTKTMQTYPLTDDGTQTGQSAQMAQAPLQVSDDPAWAVWSDEERFFLRENWTIIGESFQAHDLGRIPWVFCCLDDPSDDSPWPGNAGEDLVAADMAVWFSAVNMLKEVKSATRIPIISGNLDAAQRQQTTDTESAVELPDDVALTSHDMSMDLSLFRDTSDHVLEHVANNYGMSAALIKHQGVQSAEARDLMRVPLREMRLEQHQILRPFERELAECMSAVFASDMQDLRFATDGWAIDFGESQTPLSPKEELERFEHERRLGLTNTIDYVMDRNPDMTREMAEKYIEDNVQAELVRNRLMRPLQDISGSMGATTPDGSGQARLLPFPRKDEPS